MSNQPSLAAGSLFFRITYENSDIMFGPTLISRLPLTDGSIFVFSLGRQIVLELHKVEQENLTLVDQWITPHLIRNRDHGVNLSILWEDSKFNEFGINWVDQTRGTHNEELVLEDHAIAEMSPHNETSGGRLPIKASASVGMEKLRHLRQFIHRLRFSLEQASHDRPESILDISVHVRALVTNKTKPFLFECAHDAGVVIYCYVPFASAQADSFAPLRGMGATAFESVASPVRTESHNVQIEFQDWLHYPAILSNEVTTAHWRLIKDVADKFGAHSDSKGFELLGDFINKNYPGVDLGILAQMIFQYGVLTYTITQNFLTEVEKIEKK
jgi:hypothetical protein